MKLLLSILIILSISTSLFSQTTKKVKADSPFGEAIYISTDSLQKLPINDLLIGKWVLISSKIKSGHEEDMAQWNIQTIEFNKDRTATITPGPYDRKIYWSYIGNEEKLVIYSTEEESIQVRRVKLSVLKIKKDVFISTEWINTKPDGKNYQKLTFLKVE